MRLIDADALRKCVMKWLPKDPCGREEREFPFETDICVSMLMEIDEQPTIEPQKWIPCSERPPEVNGTYLVCYEDASVLMDWFNGHWFFYRTNPAVEETGTVTAWMPLPDPYQEEGEHE